MSVKAPPRTRPIDWSLLVFELERAGMSQRDIAVDCDYETHASVNALKNIPGTQPKFHQGALLLSLWVRVTGKVMEDVPRR